MTFAMRIVEGVGVTDASGLSTACFVWWCGPTRNDIRFLAYGFRPWRAMSSS